VRCVEHALRRRETHPVIATPSSIAGSSPRTDGATPLAVDATRVRAWHVAILLVLASAQIACGIWTAVASSDTNRDIFFAQQIASGHSFPLTGPAINSMLHLGPLWYYLMALPLLVVSNAAAVTAFMAAISALQFPLAYALGRRFGSAREGILFALALALPGWMTITLASMTHTIAVVPSLLLGVFAVLAYRERPDAKRAALIGLASAFMMTAHPTLVLIAGALIVWASMRTPSWALRFAHGALVLGLVVLAIVPVLYAQWHDGFTDVATAQKYTEAEWSVPSLIKAAKLLYAILYFGPQYDARFLLELPHRIAHPLMLIYELVLIAACAGLAMRLVADPGKRRLIAWLSALLIAQSVFICAIRDGMPPWMIYAEWPLIAALVALGLEALCARGRAMRAIVAAGLLVTTLWTLDVYARLAKAPLDHLEIAQSPGKRGAMDVREYEKAQYAFRLARIPFRQLFAIGKPLCTPVALYGHYAYFVDYTFAVSAWAECGNADNVQYGGMPEPGRRPLLGLHKSAWTRIGMQPAERIGALGIANVSAIWHSPVPLKPLLPRLTTFPRLLKIDPKRKTIAGDAPPDQAVLVSQRAHRYGPFAVKGARVDGAPVEPAYSDVTAVVFVVPPALRANASVHWEIDVDATSDYIDVLTFGSAPR
jgi:hypothetical protein